MTKHQRKTEPTSAMIIRSMPVELRKKLRIKALQDNKSMRQAVIDLVVAYTKEGGV